MSPSLSLFTILPKSSVSVLLDTLILPFTLTAVPLAVLLILAGLTPEERPVLKVRASSPAPASNETLAGKVTLKLKSSVVPLGTVTVCVRVSVSPWTKLLPDVPPSLVSVRAKVGADTVCACDVTGISSAFSPSVALLSLSLNWLAPRLSPLKRACVENTVLSAAFASSVSTTDAVTVSLGAIPPTFTSNGVSLTTTPWLVTAVLATTLKPALTG